MAFEDAVRNTQQQKAHAEYTRAKKTIEKLIDDIGKKTTLDDVFQAAKTVIIEKRGANLQATRVTTIIRQALVFSPEWFFPSFVNWMVKTGITDQRARDAINQFINAYNEHETLKNTQQGTLQQAKERLKKAAASISSGDVPYDQPANPGSLAYNGALDFFFTVLERRDLKIILQKAFDGLISAMKGLEHRKTMEAADGSESG